MKEKFKKLIEKFSAKTKKEKAKDVISIILSGILVAIAITMAVGAFISMGKKGPLKASADYMVKDSGTNWNDYQDTLFSLKKGATAYSELSAGETIEFKPYSFILVYSTSSGIWPYNITTAHVSTVNTELRLYPDSQKTSYIRLIYNIFASGTRPYGYTLRDAIDAQGGNTGSFKIVEIRAETEAQKKIRKLLWNWSGNNNIDNLVNGLEITPDDLQNQFNEGYDNGYGSGYNVGYTDGVNSVPSDFNPVKMIIEPVSKFMSTPLFGNFGIGHFFMVAMAVSISLIFLKVFAGG